MNDSHHEAHGCRAPVADPIGENGQGFLEDYHGRSGRRTHGDGPQHGGTGLCSGNLPSQRTSPEKVHQCALAIGLGASMCRESRTNIHDLRFLPLSWTLLDRTAKAGKPDLNGGNPADNSLDLARPTTDGTLGSGSVCVRSAEPF